LTRRTALSLWFILLVSVWLAGGALALAQDQEIVIRMYAGAYTPRERTQSDRWDPPSYLNVLAQEYKRLHPPCNDRVSP